MKKTSKIQSLIKKIESSIVKGEINTVINDLKELLKIEPSNYAAHAELGNCLSKLNKFEEALLCYLKADELNKNNSVILNNIGITYLFLNNFYAAEAYLIKSMECDSENFQPYINLGSAYDTQGLHQKNMNISIRGISKWPKNEIFHLNLGVALMGLNLFQEAKISFETALLLRPKYIEAELNLAALYTKTGENDIAVSIYEKFISENKNSYHERLELVKYYLSYEYLLKGILDLGWKLYTSGFNHLIPSYLKRRPDRKFEVPLWQINYEKDCRLLVWSEQGLGDELLFATILPDQIKITSNLIFECDPRLVQIFSRTYPNITVRAHSFDESNFYKQKIYDYDFHIPSGNLCEIHRNSIEKFPLKSPVLIVDIDKKNHHLSRLSEFEGQIFIGICWRSGLLTPARNSEYTSILDWGPIFSIPNACFINLQYGNCEEELKQAEEKFKIKIMRWNDIDLKNDIDNVFALIDCLDFVVTAGTAVSPMAASLRKQTYQFLNKKSWDMLGTNKYPWFDTVNIILAPDENITASALDPIAELIKKGIE